MPLKRDEKGGGTNADGSVNSMYCSCCYQNGSFVNPDMTLPEMKALVKDKMKEMGFPRFLGGFFTANMHKRERWRNQVLKQNEH